MSRPIGAGLGPAFGARGYIRLTNTSIFPRGPIKDEPIHPVTPTTTAVATTRAVTTHRTTTTSATTTASAGFYVVQRGDTYGSIATRYGISVQQLESLNPGVSPTALSIGQKIRVK